MALCFPAPGEQKTGDERLGRGVQPPVCPPGTRLFAFTVQRMETWRANNERGLGSSSFLELEVHRGMGGLPSPVTSQCGQHTLYPLGDSTDVSRLFPTELLRFLPQIPAWACSGSLRMKDAVGGSI